MKIEMSESEVLMCWAFALGTGSGWLTGTFHGAYEFSFSDQEMITVTVVDEHVGELLGMLTALMEARSELRQIERIEV